MKATKDDASNCMFPSFHDFRISGSDLFRADESGRRTRATDERLAFNDFKSALQRNPGWQSNLSQEQVSAISKAIDSNNPKIEGFTWHHHEDGSGDVVQLVDRCLHRATGHTGGWRLYLDDLEQFESDPRKR